VAALRSYVKDQGGTVVAVVALAYASGSHCVAPGAHVMIRLTLKFGLALTLLLRSFGIAATARGLTNAQARYLLCFSSIGNMERKLAEAHAGMFA